MKKRKWYHIYCSCCGKYLFKTDSLKNLSTLTINRDNNRQLTCNDCDKTYQNQAI